MAKIKSLTVKQRGSANVEDNFKGPCGVVLESKHYSDLLINLYKDKVTCN